VASKRPQSETPIRFGPAGWAYKDWEGPVYPRHKPQGFDPLTFMSRYFDTIEVNSTFYRPVPPQVAEGWADRVHDNPNFRFTAKLNRRFTHDRDKAWTKSELEATRVGFQVLRERHMLGALLLQFPWSFRRTDENREWLNDVCNAFSDFPLVVEVRHASWDHPHFFEGLSERAVGFVNIDQPMFRDSIGPSGRTTSPVGYVRVHGRNYREWFRKQAKQTERYDYFYSAKQLQPWAKRVKDMATSGKAKEIYVVTNNHFRGQAPANALMLKAMVEGEKVEAPEQLYAAFPQALRPYVERPLPRSEQLMLHPTF
jgi:uncharacterized protein YecE (DUF72 family)